MEYVSRICDNTVGAMMTVHPDGDALTNCKLSGGTSFTKYACPDTKVEVTCLETGVIERKCVSDCQDVLGIYDNLIVPHERRTALFHKYIKSMTQLSSVEASDSCVYLPPDGNAFDWLLRGFDVVEDWHKEVRKNDFLSIDFAGYKFELLGACGSVVKNMPLSSRNPGRLYDVFRAFCVLFGPCILEFRYFYLASEHFSRRCIIELDQDSVEAKRYFAKMALEVGSQCNTSRA